MPTIPPPRQPSKYSEQEIEVLEGLEPVRVRPAMYIGGTDDNGYHHLLWEILDNSVDEAINGHATRIDVWIDADKKGARVRDDGRGIPVGIHPKYKKPTLELILCTLHAGGKFSGKNYMVSGGLHGVGSSVTNALSEALTATILREGSTHTQTFSRGIATSKLKIGAGTRKHGTDIHFRPDPQIFGQKLAFDLDTVIERLEAKAYLHGGLVLSLTDLATNGTREFVHPNGIAEYLPKLVSERQKTPSHQGQFVHIHDREGEIRLEVAMLWTESTDTTIKSYANGIPTPNGGTHESALQSAVVKGLRSFIEAKKLTPKGVTLAAEDFREGLVALLSVYVSEPQFQGQTKNRLNNPEVQPQVEAVIRPALEQFLLSNGTIGEALVARVALAARAREARREATQQVTRKSAVSHRLNLPGKLADCSSTDPAESELFLVEGDSAGGSAKQGRDRKTQAILALRGKVLNTEQATLSKIRENKELQDVVSALGCGIGNDFDISKLRYGRVFLLMDADSDGQHISTLLLTFFYRHMPKLLENGNIFIALPPLFRIDAAKETYWALDEREKDRILAKLPKNVKPEISRFKGLGEMPAEDLKATTLDTKRRRALRVTIDDPVETERVMSELMGKDASARFRFIMERASEAELDL